MSSDDVGIIVTQQGIPVATAADYQKVIDTRWTFLDIEIEQEFTLSHADSGSSHYWVEKICDHKLGYRPAFYYRTLSLDLGGLSSGLYNADIVATKDAVYWRNLYVSGDPTTPIKLKIFLRLFACDITTTYQAPVDFFVPGAPINEPDVGVKILANQGDITSGELSNFSVDTLGKAFAIQQTGLATALTTTPFTLTITHNMGYPPTYFIAPTQSLAEFDAHTIFSNPLSDPVIYAITTLPVARVSATTTQLVLTGVQSVLAGTYAFLITKEPSELAV